MQNMWHLYSLFLVIDFPNYVEKVFRVTKFLSLFKQSEYILALKILKEI